MLARWQVALLHSIPAELGISDEHRRLIQLNHGGAESATQMSYAGFVRCLAFYETQGWRDTGRPARYWSRQAADALAPVRAKAIKLASLLRWTDAAGLVELARLDGFVARQTAGRRARLVDCDRGDLGAVIEGLKSLCRADPQASAQLIG